MSSDSGGRPRRSAGMRGNPLDGKPEHGPINTTPKPKPEQPRAAPAPSSRYPAPKVLMGEVAAPKGQMIAVGREALRAFMLRRRLQPSVWAREAGVAPGEILAFLSGKARSIPRASLEKLAAVANCTADDLFR